MWYNWGIMTNQDELQLNTVSGSVAAKEIMLVEAHAHVWINPPRGVAPRYRFELNDPRRIEAELKDFRSAGGTLLLDCQPGGAGRDARMLAKLSQAAELHIAAVTGFHLSGFYPADFWLWRASEQDAASYFVNELTTGLQEKEGSLAAAIKVGFLDKIEGQTRVLMEAAAEAARQTGAGVLFHTEGGHNVEALPLFFEDRGVPISRLYLCHVDRRPDIGLHRELAAAGALLGYDSFIRPDTKPEQNVWPLLVAMVNGGLAGRIAISLDMARKSRWQHYGGGPGLVALPDNILPRLHHEGFSETDVAGLVGQNVVRFLIRAQS
jgi:phosphotriesterase-related protein